MDADAMENFDKITSETLDNYFTVLSKLGYVSQDKLNAMVLLVFLQEILVDYQEYITEEDYNLIQDLLACLGVGACLVPYPEYKTPLDPLFGYEFTKAVRITQDGILRDTWDADLRLEI